MSVDVSRLSPADAAVALRSFPRRFRAALTDVGDGADEQERPLRRPGPDGYSALQHADRTGRALAAASEALHQVAVHERPNLPAAAADGAACPWAEDARLGLGAVLDVLASESNALADAVERYPSSAWERSGRPEGSGPELTALDLVRRAVQSASDGLRAAQAAVDAAGAGSGRFHDR
ncbi:MAG: hypothetical protein ACT4PW_09500 [Acidimicrobiia bacterium]